MRHGTRWWFLPLSCVFAIAVCLAVSVSGQTPGSVRQERSLFANDLTGGLIRVDVVVTDKSGKPAAGLNATDFTVLDNGQKNKILSFRALNEASPRPGRPVEIILVIDTLRMPGILVSHEREEVETFLRRSRGHLAQPVSLFRLRDTGLWLLADHSNDNDGLAAEIARDDPGQSIRKALGPQGLFGSGPSETPGLLSLKSLADILTLERQKPGRKLLIWIGPHREENGMPFEQKRVFNMIVWFSTLLREARVVLYSYSEDETLRDFRSMRYRDFLSGVKAIGEAGFEDLDRKVLAIQSGGRVLNSPDELSEQLSACVAKASDFYTLSFNPTPANHPNEYHDLTIQVRTSGLTARSNTGYYDQVYYHDRSNLAAKHLTVEQLGQVLKGLKGKSDRDVAHVLSTVALTERLSAARLSSWMSSFRGAKTHEALVALADVSAFLAPPAAEIPANPPPNANEQREMISLADGYLDEAIPKLPNFFATRTTVRFEETPLHDENGSAIEHRPLHIVDSSKEKVLYRRGYEVVDAEAAKPAKQNKSESSFATYGTFGPILGAASDALVDSTELTWSRWEQDADKVHAVFRYTTRQEKSHFRVGYCCLPDGDGTTSLQIAPAYHGEITLDPSTGAILWLTMQADLDENLPIVRAEVVVNYGPVEIGGQTYIAPVRSVSLWRSRTVSLLTLMDWGESFRSFGPFATMLSDMNFNDYHIFRAESHVVTEVPAPEKK